MMFSSVNTYNFHSNISKSAASTMSNGVYDTHRDNGSVTEVPGRHLVHNGDLTELDAESFTQIQKVYAFLPSDSLMIATWLPKKKQASEKAKIERIKERTEECSKIDAKVQRLLAVQDGRLELCLQKKRLCPLNL